MRIADLFSSKNAVWSFEVFPPKQQSGMESISSTLARPCRPFARLRVRHLQRGRRQQERAHRRGRGARWRALGMEPLAHITCVNSTRAEVLSALNELSDAGVENVLALRGDRVEGASSTDFGYASDLISFIKSEGSASTSPPRAIPKGTPRAKICLRTCAI